jgi:MscS family membrane protein
MSKYFIRGLTLIAALTVFPPFLAPAFAQILPAAMPVATPTGPTDSLGRGTPYGTVFGFLEAAQSGNYAIASQYLQLTPARRQTDGETLAQKLKTVMDSAFAGSLKHVSQQPEGTPQEGIPSDRQNLGSMSSGDVESELQLVRVSNSNSGKIWLISSDTLTRVPELYDQVQARQMESRLPPWLVKHQFAGMPLWQWCALILLIPVTAGAAWLLLLLLQIPIRWWARRNAQAELVSQSVSGPAWLLIGTLFHRVATIYLGIPLLQRHYYSEVTAVAITIGANWILWRLVRWFLHRLRDKALLRGHGGTGSLMLLGERLIKAFIFVMTIFFIFGVLGFNLSTALAGVGIGTLAVGFGAQQTIANLFGGVSVLGDEVIRVGDVCKFGDRTGVVEDIGLRSTRVRTEERTLLSIPNGTVATINVENLSRRDKILFKTTLGMHLDTSAEHLRAVMSEMNGVLTGHSKIEKDSIRVRLVEIGASALNVELVCYILTRDFNEFATVREEVLLAIMNLVEESGASMASPSQTLYLSDYGSSKPEAKTTLEALRDSTQGKSKPAKEAASAKPDEERG